MPSLHGFRSRSRSQCSSSSKPSVRPRPSTDSHDSSSSVVSYKSSSTLADDPPAPALPPKQLPHPALALYPFLANLPRFGGAPGEDIDLWLLAVDAVARHVGAPPDAPVPLVPILLRGDAFQRFVRIHHATRGRLTSWNEWKDHLRTEFRAPGYLQAKRAELAARGWRQSETLAHYFDARRELQMVVMPDADEDELVQDMLAGVPLRQRRLVTDTIPPEQREEPTLVDVRRAMVDCEVEMRGRERLRAPEPEPQRVQTHSPRSRTGSSAPPSAFDKRMVLASAPLSPPLTPPARGDMPPPPTITVSS